MNDYEHLTPKELLKESERLKSMAKRVEQNYPDWYDGSKVDETAYCKWILSKQEMRCMNKKLYTMDGFMDDEKMKSKIVLDLQLYVRTGLYKKASQILDTLKAMCYSEPILPSDDRIHFTNGTYHLENGFSSEKEWTMNRLPVEYHADANPPVRWLEFINELLYEEDITSVQEFLGYTLIGTNKGQTMLLIIGNGGEGKSRINAVMQKMLGNNMNVGPINHLEESAFARATLEGKLLLVDDDMKMSALKSTNILKSIVTCEGMLSVEEKNKQPYQAVMYARIIGLGNGNLSALHDKSVGFYRRQLIIRTKDKKEDRADDPFLLDKLEMEIPGILLWCLDGLHRLIRNNYKFSVSDRSRELKNSFMEEENTIQAFFNSTGYVRFDKEKTAATSELYEEYQKWCRDNMAQEYGKSTFEKYLKQNFESLSLEYSKNIKRGDKSIRGYKGIEIVEKGFRSLLPGQWTPFD